ncbi:MAG: glycerophosphodiester phosphodiesterase family protein [Hyphomonadaceae bacterium]
MRKRWFALGFAVLTGAVLFCLNTSLLAHPDGQMRLLAHRGVHQRYDTAGLDNETCTAARIFEPTNAFIENTLPSMRAAFDAGADMVEIDVHPTTDGEFAVFHDWTLDCRTDGEGVTREHSMAELRALDVGYGYTADGGTTFPFRGHGVGLMPTLREVLTAFPDRAFLINFKSRDPSEGDAMLAYLEATPELDMSRLAFFGAAPATRLRELRPDARIVSRRGLKQCGLRYLAIGWFGAIPDQCRNTLVFVPVNYAPLMWGWPNRFLTRMRAAGSEVYIAGPISLRGPLTSTGVDDAQTFARVPHGWRGGVSTDAIEVIGPLAAESP